MKILRIEFDKVLSNFGGDKHLLKGTVNLSLKYLPTYFERIKIALSTNNMIELELAAHTLKGSLSIYLYKPIVELAYDLEKFGQIGNLEGAQNLIIDLEIQLNIFLKELHDFKKSFT